MPIVALTAGAGALVLQFDHTGDEIRDYLYTIVHCDSGWKPSDLVENDYINGFTEDRITDFQNSFNTLSQYVHYTLALPNRNMRWSKSGNYLLKVYDDTDEKTLVLVRRFCVVESAWRIDANFVKTVAVSKMNTHHEIDFTINYGTARISNPQNDVKAFVLQNGNWFDAIGPIQPYLSRGDQLIYDYQDKIVFPAKKDWRTFDIRTFDMRSENVKSIVTRPTYYEVTLKPDQSRSGLPAIYRGDINGRFAIENQDNRGFAFASNGGERDARPQSEEEIRQMIVQCDYSKVLFSILQNLPLEEADVYIFGELSDWQLKPEFKMEYNHEVRAYICEAWLKQGLYNYEYRVVNRSTGQVDEEGFEGNWHETPNMYTILAYFKPFGARYERLMGTATIDSKIRQ